jgi:hypothetical protein
MAAFALRGEVGFSPVLSIPQGKASLTSGFQAYASYDGARLTIPFYAWMFHLGQDSKSEVPGGVYG